MSNIPRAGVEKYDAVHIIHSTNMTPETGSRQRKYALAVSEAGPPHILIFESFTNCCIVILFQKFYQKI